MPTLGEHTREVMDALSYSAADIEALLAAGEIAAREYLMHVADAADPGAKPGWVRCYTPPSLP